MKGQDTRAKQIEGKVKVDERRRPWPLNLGLSFGLIILTGWLGVRLSPVSIEQVWAEPAAMQPSGKLKGNVGRGREIFNGKGACHLCHGIDGYLARKPRLEADTAALIARLNPPPPDLRNPGALRLKTNKERARAIREGHPGTGMFPDLTMTDQDLADTLIYLALLRRDPNPMAD